MVGPAGYSYFGGIDGLAATPQLNSVTGLAMARAMRSQGNLRSHLQASIGASLLASKGRVGSPIVHKLLEETSSAAPATGGSTFAVGAKDLLKALQRQGHLNAFLRRATASALFSSGTSENAPKIVSNLLVQISRAYQSSSAASDSTGRLVDAVG